MKTVISGLLLKTSIYNKHVMNIIKVIYRFYMIRFTIFYIECYNKFVLVSSKLLTTVDKTNFLLNKKNLYTVNINHKY